MIGLFGQAADLSFVTIGSAPPAPERLATVPELDYITDGGVVPGATVMMRGAPGAGKSTLLLAAAAAVPGSDYYTGEEGLDMVAARAVRIGAAAAEISLVATDNADAIAAAILQRRPPLAVVDSLQTVFTSTSRGAPRSQAQMIAVAALLVGAARKAGTALILVCQETKDGGFAGPRGIEHLVDMNIALERGPPRYMVAIKNRHGQSDRPLLLRMTSQGLHAADGIPRDLAAEVNAVAETVAGLREAMSRLRERVAA